VLKTRVMPCLLLRNRGLVKTVAFKDPSYVGDPINTVRIYNEKEVDELILLDITATPTKKPPNHALISEIASECFMPLTYGGGIRSLEDASALFGVGAEKVAVNTAARESPRLIHEIADAFGSQSVVASIDVKRTLLGAYEVYVAGGRTRTHVDPVRYAQDMEKAGAGEILLTAIDRDGTMEGYDLALIQSVTRSVSIPVIACGGAGTVNDFALAKRAGASAVAAGSMVVFQGKNRSVLINFPSKRVLKEALG
jgi:cyclase